MTAIHLTLHDYSRRFKDIWQLANENSEAYNYAFNRMELKVGASLPQRSESPVVISSKILEQGTFLCESYVTHPTC